ncbi:MAG: hypothetical protein EAX96_15990 [Candidatus Lokiarchaeota archaeon]|nr:hypothetical protein [Candidatus Lokiarchaeota archaeon]
MNFKAIEFLKSGNLEIQDYDLDLDSALQSFNKYLEVNLKRIIGFNNALFLSGGIDSSILAYKLNDLRIDFKALIIANEKEPDYRNAIEIADKLDIEINEIKLTLDKFENIIPEVIKILSDTEEKQVNIAAPFLLGAKYLQKKGFEIAILGQGADELFCGYQRYVDFLQVNPDQFKEFHLNDIKESVLQNFTRDNAIFSNYGIKICLPYFTENIIKLALSIPVKFLVNNEVKSPIKKFFLREYAKKLGIPKIIHEKKKIAIQFGSGSYKLLRKIALKNGFTKEISEKFGYRRHVQLYLDYLAQELGIKELGLNIDEITRILKI